MAATSADIKMSAQIYLLRKFRYQNLLVKRSMPTLFIIVCFFIIANSRCDSVGSANVSVSELAKDETIITTSEKPKPNGAKKQYDPYSMLREIYLGQNSKVITMLMPDQVQKFHPNGRYGRRSVSTLVDRSSHTELGKLNQREPLKSHFNSYDLASYSNSKDEANLRYPAVVTSTQKVESQRAKQQQQEELSDSSLDSSLPVNFEQELNKLLKCNYTGVSNLYWCDTGN